MPLATPPRTKSLANTVMVIHETPPAGPLPTRTEVDAALFAQCYIFGEFNPVPNTNVGEGPAFWCDDEVEQEDGRTTWSVEPLQYTYMPQLLGTPGSVGNEVYEALTPGTELVVSLFHGVSGRLDALPDEVAVGDVFKIKALSRARSKTGDTDLDKKTMTQQIRMVGKAPLAIDHVFPATP